jgi:hypothetical protein
VIHPVRLVLFGSTPQAFSQLLELFDPTLGGFDRLGQFDYSSG